MNKIYTRKGDKGFTTLVGGKKVSKTCLRVEAYGSIDELNAFVGSLFELVKNKQEKDFLFWLMNKLFLIGSHIATDESFEGKQFFKEITDADTEDIETEIDILTAKLPKIKNFILPVGSSEAALAHVCRAVCRRVERTVLRLNDAEAVPIAILTFLNRLSDYFFILARFLANEYGKGDVVLENL